MTPDPRTPDDPAEGDLDDLFADDRFQEYDDSLIGNPFVDAPSAEQPSEQAADAAADSAVDPAPPTTPFVAAPFESGVPVLAPLAPGSYSGAPGVPTASGDPTVATTVIAGAPATTALPGATPSGANQTGSILRPAKKKFSLARFWAGLNTGQKAIAWAGGAVILLFILAALFSLGTALPGLFPDKPADGETSEALGPLEPGTYPFAELRGGECLSPYGGVWEEEYTVVDCEGEHPAQFAYRGYVGPEVTVYLDAEGWQGLTTTLCDGALLLDYAVASEFTDLQWQLSYAGDATEWANGDRSYGCFLSRASGEQLTGSLIRDDVPAATPPPSQEPTGTP